MWGWTYHVDKGFNFFLFCYLSFLWSNFYPLCSGLDQGELEITFIVIIDFGEVTSAFGCYLYITSKVDNTGYSSMIINAHKLNKYILITMNCCNGRLLLLLEDDGLTVDDIIPHISFQVHQKIRINTLKLRTDITSKKKKKVKYE